MKADLRLPLEVVEQMRAEVERWKPEEACGLLAGRGGRVEAALPVENALHSATRYRMEPQQQLEAMTLLDERGWELCAIYHSHPNGPDAPSPTDIAEAYIPEAVYILWFRRGEGWAWRGFWIQEGQARPADVAVE
ncbi:MAG: M67 family metallopeptidase [Chloroflexi bacterium]|nr:M67 family metallopeptidase [Chloroflexota bacterium]